MVLAGQKPEVIMEICSRALAFWTYQVLYVFNFLHSSRIVTNNLKAFSESRLHWLCGLFGLNFSQETRVINPRVCLVRCLTLANFPALALNQFQVKREVVIYCRGWGFCFCFDIEEIAYIFKTVKDIPLSSKGMKWSIFVVNVNVQSRGLKLLCASLLTCPLTQNQLL